MEVAWIVVTSGGSGNTVGVDIEASNNNIIGGLTPTEQNIISGNTLAGIRVIDGIKTEIVNFNFPSGWPIYLQRYRM